METETHNIDPGNVRFHTYGCPYCHQPVVEMTGAEGLEDVVFDPPVQEGPMVRTRRRTLRGNASFSEHNCPAEGSD